MESKIEYVKEGLADYYSDGTIKLNEKLKEDKELHDFVLTHELGHSNNFDLFYEIKDAFRLMRNPRICLKLFAFTINNLKLIDFLPLQRKNKTWIYDINLLILYSISLILLGTISYIVYLVTII